MTGDLEHARARLESVVCGDLGEDSAEWQECVRRFPQLGDELRELRAIQGAIDWSDADAEAVAAAAARSAAGAPRRRGASRVRWRWPLLLAALLVALLGLQFLRPPSPPVTGPLGAHDELAVRVVERQLRAVGFAALDVSGGFTCELWVDGTRADTFQDLSAPTTFPPRWLELVERSRTAEVRLVQPPGPTLRIER